MKNNYTITEDIKTLIDELVEAKRMELFFWDRPFLTLNQASKYTNIGVSTLRKYLDDNQEKLVIYVGTKRMIKKDELVECLKKEKQI